MSQKVRLACDSKIVTVGIDKILPLKQLSASVATTPKYECISASIREVGIIEPLIIFPHQESEGTYTLLDGHVRLHVVRNLGRKSVDCFVALDDETFTYNHKINRLSAIPGALHDSACDSEWCVRRENCEALNVDVASICKKRDLLEGICPEAVTLLKDRPVTACAIREMRKVKPIRQIEIAELMAASNNFSTKYAKCMLAATPDEQLVESEKPKEVAGLSKDDLAKIEKEMQTLEADFLSIQETHGKNVLNLVIVVGYIKRLCDNGRVVRFLSQHYSELLAQFQDLIEEKTLVESNGQHDTSPDTL